MLRRAIETVQSRRPFAIAAIVLLPEHLHAICELPSENEDFSTRVSVIKVLFSKGIVMDDDLLSASRSVRRERGLHVAFGGAGFTNASFATSVICRTTLITSTSIP